jgi:hypothetical protein
MTMKFFKDGNDEVYAYADDGSQDAFIKPGLTAITAAEAATLANPAPTVEQQRAALIAQMNALEAGQHRATREAILSGDMSWLKKIDDEVAALRAQLAAL